jgi:hypothetical protein
MGKPERSIIGSSSQVKSTRPPRRRDAALPGALGAGAHAQ